MDRGAWLAAVHRVTKSRTALEQLNTALNDVLHQMNFVSIYIHTHIYMCVCIHTEQSIPRHQNTHSFQVHMRHSRLQIKY